MEPVAYKSYLYLTLTNRYKANDACVAFSPAHLHIDLLPTYQRQGWGRKLIGALVERLKEMGLTGVWLGMDPKNVDARVFYERLGFKRYEGMQDHEVGLQFEDRKY
jgi:GNAT superfamily N-acetyltransferase